MGHDAGGGRDEARMGLPTTEGEFHSFWNLQLSHHAGWWAVTKLAYPVGSSVLGNVLIYYPQGTIVHFGNGVVGVCDDRRLGAGRSVGFKVRGVVAGYDDSNLWLTLDSVVEIEAR
jgi:hypothetical protein